jgi:hypothetical protein
VRRLEGPIAGGLHRIDWDMRGPSPEPIDLSPAGFQAPWDEPDRGPLVAPGRYTATLMIVSAAGARAVGAPQSFEVKAVPNLPPGTDPAAVAAFQQQVAELRRRAAGTGAEIGRVRDELRHMRTALVAAPRAEPALFARIDAASAAAAGLARRLNGDPARQRLNEPDRPSIGARIRAAMSTWDTRQMPTATHRRDAEIAGAELTTLAGELDGLVAGELAKLRAALEAAGAPWTPRR